MSMLKIRWFYRYSSTFKGILFLSAMLIILAQIWYTQTLVKKLKEDQRQIVQLNARWISNIASDETSEDLTGLFDYIVDNLTFPAILTDLDNNVQYQINLDIEDHHPYRPEVEKRLNEIIEAMDKNNTPIPIESEGIVLNMLHYGDSEMIGLLNWLPAIEVFTIGLFIFLAFIGYSNIQRSETRNIWVGMAKETAHQLGTPISALLGWVELILEQTDSSKTADVVKEMKNDIDRLNKVAQRFSLIGSSSDLEEYEVKERLQEIVAYFRRRLPQFGKGVKIKEHYNIDVKCMLNRDLFEWAVENLIKNSLDAVENGNGEIKIVVDSEGEDRRFFIDIIDTGKGMIKKQQKKIFKPGYSTKKRGWGLGLNFTKRIIEDYHKGKLFLKNSRLNEGTTIRIILNKSC